MIKPKYAIRTLKGLLTRRKNGEGAYLTEKEAEIYEAYKVTEIEPAPIKPHHVQQMETEGKLPFDDKNYHCDEYNDLMKSVSKVRSQYADSKSHETRKKLAKEEIAHWHTYVEKREKVLPEKYMIPESMLSSMKDVFERESERRTMMLRSDRVLDFHHIYAKNHRFEIPIHAHNLTQMVHPYHGYLCNIEGKQFTFEELIQIYKYQIVSSYERDLGQTYLADELA